MLFMLQFLAHLKCSGLNKTEFESHTKNKNFYWTCPECIVYSCGKCVKVIGKKLEYEFDIIVFTETWNSTGNVNFNSGLVAGYQKYKGINGSASEVKSFQKVFKVNMRQSGFKQCTQTKKILFLVGPTGIVKRCRIFAIPETNL